MEERIKQAKESCDKAKYPKDKVNNCDYWKRLRDDLSKKAKEMNCAEHLGIPTAPPGFVGSN